MADRHPLGSQCILGYPTQMAGIGHRINCGLLLCNLYIGRNPGSLRRNPGSLRRNPGSLRRNPGSLRRNPGSLRRNPGSLRRNPGSIRRNQNRYRLRNCDIDLPCMVVRLQAKVTLMSYGLDRHVRFFRLRLCILNHPSRFQIQINICI